MLRLIANIVTQEERVVYVILVNSIVLFLDAFPHIHRTTSGWLEYIDTFCTLYFILEIVCKLYLHGPKKFWESGWNRFDFWVILLALPSLFTFSWNQKAFSVLLLLRFGRLIKFFRLLRFTPNGEHIWAGILRSTKASVSVFLAILLLNLLFAMGATFLFGELAPEFFGNPLKSWYALFKVFTVEGWYEVPDLIYARSGAATWAVGLRLYYVFAVFLGGILGFALANAVFVDEMTSDNTRYVENLVKETHAEQMALIQELREEIRALKGDNHEHMA